MKKMFSGNTLFCHESNSSAHLFQLRISFSRCWKYFILPLVDLFPSILQWNSTYTVSPITGSSQMESCASRAPT